MLRLLLIGFAAFFISACNMEDSYAFDDIGVGYYQPYRHHHYRHHPKHYRPHHRPNSSPHHGWPHGRHDHGRGHSPIGSIGKGAPA